jgi:hypothetical protein
LFSVSEEDAPAKVLDPLKGPGAELLSCEAEGTEYELLGTASGNSAVVCCWPFDCETAAELLTPTDGTANTGEPYTGDGMRNAEEPSSPDDIGSAYSVSSGLPASALLTSDVPEFIKYMS